MNIPPTAILMAVVTIVALGVTGVILSPVNTVAIIGFCAISIPSLLALLKSGEAAAKVAEVKIDLASANEKTNDHLVKIEATGEKTHTLVNSNMGAQLKLNAVATRRLAELTRDPVDVEAALLAERTLKDHEGKQARVDAVG